MKKKIFKKIFICSTEQSGDNIGHGIIVELKKKFPLLIFEGVGGSKMKPFLRKQFYSLKDFKSIGIVEIIFSIKKYITIIDNLSKSILKNKYDLVLTIDSPDFNYPLVKKIRKNGYHKNIIHAVAPTVWAWRKNRAKKFAKIYDEILTLFPFENQFFEKFNLKATCIGHPIFYFKNIYLFHKKKEYIAFLPGSRLKEIESLFPYFQIAYEHLVLSNNKLKIFIPTLPHLKKQIISRTKYWKIKTIVKTNDKEIEKFFLKTKIALVCSGTATLEIAKRGIPQLIIYKFNFFTVLIARIFIRIKFANIINILENKMIIPELVNLNLTKKSFISKFKDFIINTKSNDIQIKNVKKSIKKLEKTKSPSQIAIKSISKYL